MLPIAIIPQGAEDVLNDILGFWEGLFGSWGLAIILLTFTIRLAILPLTFKSVKSMQALQVLQPEMKKIQERFKDDKQRMNQEMMRFYQENKVNPLGSCLPLLLQVPFFIALFELLRSSNFKEEIAGNESFLFLSNLAAPLIGDKGTGEVPELVFMIVLYVGTQLAASAVTMVSADKMQRRIMLSLPFFFVIFIVFFEAGLMVYWITTNVWTIGQQLVVRKLYPRPDVVGATSDDDEAASKPARGKPAGVAAAVKDGAKGSGNGKGSGTKASTETGAKSSGAKSSNGGGSNGARAKPPPGSPRKKKKRSGRRR